MVMPQSIVSASAVSATHDGVFGMWYGKAPGVDRTGDVFKHANFAGTWAKGGVLAVAGDDHACKSSTLPSQSEFAFQDFEMPVLSPADVQEVLDYGLLGYAMSRYSGLWVSLIALADTMDSGATIDISTDRHKFVLPENFSGTEDPFVALSADGVAVEAAIPLIREKIAAAEINKNEG